RAQLFGFPGLRIVDPQRIRAHAANPDPSLLVDRQAVRTARHGNLADLAALAIELAEVPAALPREPDVAFRVDHRGMRIAALRRREVIDDLPARRVQLADRAVAVPGIEDLSVGCDDEAVRPRSVRQV